LDVRQASTIVDQRAAFPATPDRRQIARSSSHTPCTVSVWRPRLGNDVCDERDRASRDSGRHAQSGSHIPAGSAELVGGFGIFAASFFLNIHMDQGYSGDQLLVPNPVRTVGQALVMTPLSSLATAGIERVNAGSASSLMRNRSASPCCRRCFMATGTADPAAAWHDAVKGDRSQS
jgi:hypothetical protein